LLPKFAASAVVVLALALAACGGDDSSSSSDKDSGSGGGSADIAALETQVEEHSAPGKIGPTVPIKGEIPKGLKLVYIKCSDPSCVSIEASLKEAASELGWSVESIPADPTPESIQEAFDEAVRRAPDAVLTNGFATEQYPRQAKELNRLGIPIISGAGTDPSSYDPKKGVTLQLLRYEEIQQAAALLAKKAVVDIGGEGTIGTVLLTGYPSVKYNVEAFEDEVKKICSDCKVKQISVQPTAIGKDAPAQLTNFLRANPDVKALYFGYDGTAIGFASALKGAGVDAPLTYAWAPNETGIQDLQTGARSAAIPLGYHETGWQFADAVARLNSGGDVKDSQPWQPFVIWSNDFDNVPEDANNPPIIPDYQEQFKALWGK
jgi:ABC-type sugar transport system substrate-binding protein